MEELENKPKRQRKPKFREDLIVWEVTPRTWNQALRKEEVGETFTVKVPWLQGQKLERRDADKHKYSMLEKSLIEKHGAANVKLVQDPR